MKHLSSSISILFFVLVSSAAAGTASSFNPEMTAFIQKLEMQAKREDKAFTGFDMERGKKIFFEEHASKKEGKISCATCHTSDLKQKGLTSAGKVIKPLAPSVNKERLTIVKEVEKWLLRNFKQVYGREGTAREKGDVLLFINSK